ncbi:HD-GYP domain-containing protein [Marinomonas ostreistagni]|nr:HD domain-containing phosphohydrolase [Marinomonas ostreistagni]
MMMDKGLDVDLRQMIIVIETAVSLVGMDDTNHGKRVGFIASQLGYELGFSEADIRFAFEFGLLHDCGVSTESMHNNLVNQFNWDGANIHCEIGYRLLKDFAPLAKFATPIRHHHTSWSELSELNISAYDARMTNLIFLADRIDVQAAAHYGKDILLVKDQIVADICARSGSYFNPVFIEAFKEVQRSEAFWIALEDRHITRYTWEMGHVPSSQRLTLPQIKHLSLILSYVVDQKSPFTAQHSVRVADVARFLAQSYGLSEVQCDKVEIAGLLHDLGKLHTPDKILDKPGPLDPSERAIMNQHSYETYEILRHIPGLEEIARWAAFHHEGINGKGYPFHPSARELSVEARIIAVADIFQALVQNRPYRAGIDLSTALSMLSDMAEEGKLDRDIVGLATKLDKQCYEIAKGSDPNGNQNFIRLFE